jgi:hypothetical protein
MKVFPKGSQPREAVRWLHEHAQRLEYDSARAVLAQGKLAEWMDRSVARFDAHGIQIALTWLTFKQFMGGGPVWFVSFQFDDGNRREGLMQYWLRLLAGDDAAKEAEEVRSDRAMPVKWVVPKRSTQ